jgi:protocatechuate 3,4-dioxygenase beta subunit
MQRKKFLKNGILGLGSLFTVSAIPGNNKNQSGEAGSSDQDCPLSPRETRGPFPTKTPSQLMQANIQSDRKGIALLVNLTILNKNDNCQPLAEAVVDIWHCDKDGNYSEYGNHRMQREDFTAAHFLRGRQTTDKNGRVSFLSIYPGWYHGRAPHIHFEIFNSSGSSLLVTQVAFPENISGKVYASSLYAPHGHADTTNTGDMVFADSLPEQLATVTGNLSDGFTMSKTIIVKT